MKAKQVWGAVGCIIGVAIITGAICSCSKTVSKQLVKTRDTIKNDWATPKKK